MPDVDGELASSGSIETGVSVFRCSSSQQRLWLLEQLGRGGGSLHVRAPLVLRRVDMGAVQFAVDQLIARHESLRTTFGDLDGIVVQRVHPVGALPVAVGATDLRAVSPGERATRIAALGDEMAAPAFDLSCGPLMRAHLVKASERSAALLLVFHHIVVDGWSVRLIHDELTAGLEAAGQGADWTGPPLQYADYAAWQQACLADGRFADDIRWWTRQFERPARRPGATANTASQAASGVRVQRHLGGGVVGALTKLATERDTTRSSVLLAAFVTALARLTGQRDHVVGVPVAGRRRPELEGVVGFFVNTLPIRVIASEHLIEVVDAVRDVMIEALERQDVPYEEIARHVTMPGQPLFDTMFNYIDGRALVVPTRERRDEDVAVEAAAHSDVELYVHDLRDELRVELVFVPDRLTEHAARLVLDDLEDVLGGIVTGRPVAPLAVDPGRPHWATTSAVQSPFERFLEVAAERDNGCALRTPEGDITYGALAARVTAVSAAVAARVPAGARVGVLADGTPGIEGILGVLGGGAVYVVLDDRSPPPRLADIVDDAGITLVLTASSCDARTALVELRPALQWLDLDDVEPAPTVQGSRSVDVDAPAYLLYTSGTTGVPKAVVQSHRNLLGNARTYANSLGMRPADAASLVAGLGTDAALMDVFGALLSGAVLCPIDLRRVGFPELAAVVADLGVSVLHVTPTVFRMLCAELEGAAEPAPPAVRAVVLGGEPAKRSDLTTFQRCFGPTTQLINGFGPTEATVAMQFVAGAATQVPGDELPLGDPVDGVSITVEDDLGGPVEPGDTGEIVVRGPHVALGYWERPDTTRAAFPDAAGPVVVDGVPVARRYRTGDLAHRHLDGALTHAGRLDDELKVRGYRIDPAEIELALTRDPNVRAAAIESSSPLTAHLVLAPDATTSAVQLRRLASQFLPEHMVPTRFVVVDELPRTASGKLDRRSLRSTADARHLPERLVATTTRVNAAEQAIAAIWAEVLGIDELDIAADDTFFDFGGQSLQLTKVAARLLDRANVRIPLATLFTNPSLAQLAAELTVHWPGAVATPERITRRGDAGPYQLSSAQARLWFLEELNPGEATYTVSTSVALPPRTSPSDVQAAVDELVARHDSLRTTFTTIDGTPIQVLHPSSRIRVATSQLADPARLTTRRTEIARRLAAATFDLRTGPLLRVHLIDANAHGAWVQLAVHHIVADGWSVALLRRELAELIAARRERRDAELAPIELRYVDYVAWESERLSQRDASLAWWAEALDGVPTELALPADRPRPASPTSRGELARRTVEPELFAACRALARAHATTPFVIYLAILGVVLHRWSGRSNFIVGTPVAGRTRVETEPLVGLFVNSLPLPLSMGSDDSFVDVLARIRDIVTAAQDHQDVPFEDIVRRLAPRRRLAAAPLFQVMLAHAATTANDGVASPDDVVHTATAKFDLSMTVDDGPMGCIFLEHALDVVDARAAHALLDAMVAAMRSVVADPARPVGQVGLGPASLLIPSKGTLDTRPAGFRRWSAVAYADGISSADQVRRQSTEIARRLRAIGVGPGSVVAIEVPRGPAIVASMRAVHDVGATFVPIDPHLPNTRRRELLDAAGASTTLVADGRPQLLADQQPDVLGALRGGYVIATSGTTGRPKLVVVPQDALDAQLPAIAHAYELSADDRVLQFASLGFDVAIEEILTAVEVGATIDFGRHDDVPTFAELDDLCGPGGVTVLNLPASYWHEWVGYLTQRRDARIPNGLRLVVVGSEPVRPLAVAAWQALAGSCRLLVAYGTSETTITNAVYEPPPNHDWAQEDTMPIGRPLPGTRIVVVDTAGIEVPPGALGELVIEGPCVAQGYLGDDERTAAQFVDVPHGRRYRTGDIGRRRFDGALELTGRIDNQLKIAGVRIEPTEVESAVIAASGAEEAVVVSRPDSDGRAMLVAYLVATDGKVLDAAHLRQLLRDRLPVAMIPSGYAVVSSLPRRAGGQLDYTRLPDPPSTSMAGTFRPPQSPNEHVIAEIWSTVLRIPQPDIAADADFFDLGGDSILMLHVAWQLGTRSITVRLADLYRHPTLDALARSIDEHAAFTPEPDVGADEIALPLTPIQRWFLDQDHLEPAHDNMAVLLDIDREVAPEAIGVAVAAVVAAHGALRSRFTHDGERWTGVTIGAADEPVAVAIHADNADIREVAAHAHAALDLELGPVFRVDVVPGRAPQALLVAHHLVVDVVSWQIIVADLQAALDEVLAGQIPTVRPTTATWAAWCRRLDAWAASADAGAQAEWWLDRSVSASGPVLPVDGPAAGPAGDEVVTAARLTADETAQLLRRLSDRHDARVEEAVVAAIAMAAVGDDRTVDAVVVVDIEGHGREPLFPDVDVARTVGWFTSIRPVFLSIGIEADPLQVLTATRRFLRTMPRHGLAHGAVTQLRPPDDELRLALQALPRAQIAVNYLGRIDGHPLDAGAAADGDRGHRARLRPAGPAPGPARSVHGLRPYLVDVVAAVRDGQLLLWFTHGGAPDARASATAFAGRVVAALSNMARASDPHPDGRTTRDAVVARQALTPMQAAMWLAAEAAPGVGVYVEHAVVRVPAGVADRELHQAWQRTVARHDILRTRFVVGTDGAPRQEVLGRVELPWRVVDWRHLSIIEGEARLEALLDDDRRRGFDVGVAPLMRCVLVHLADGARLVWSHHHALLDGWSAVALLEATFTECRSGRAIERTAPEVQFEDYVSWLARRDLGADDAYWRRQLEDRPETRSLPTHDVPGDAPAVRAFGVALAHDDRSALARQARRLRVGLATIIDAAWAIVLAEHLRADDVVFAVVSSGRPPDLVGADRMIGLLVTTHPTRVRLVDDEPVSRWLQRLDAVEQANREHGHAGMAEIGRWVGATPSQPLVESIVVVQNYRRGPAGAAPRLDEDIHELRPRELTDVPLNVVADADGNVKLLYDARRFEAAWVVDVLGALRTTLIAIGRADASTAVGDLRTLQADTRRRVAAWNSTARDVPIQTLGAQWRATLAEHWSRVAVIEADGRAVRYEELGRAADRVTTRLRQLGVRPGGRVGIAAERSGELLAAVLGVVQADCAYVPLDTTLPDERLAFQIDQTRMAVAISHARLRSRLPRDLAVVEIDDVLAAQWGPADDAELAGGGHVDQAAYITYTSGSTGRPKGVVVPHRAVTRLVRNADYCELGPHDAVAFSSTFAFDASTFEMWGPLLAGGRAVVIHTETLLTPIALRQVLRDAHVTAMFVTTAAFNAIVADVPDTFSSLRTLLFGGERVDPGTVRAVLATAPPQRLIHVYGPTETTTFASWHEVRAVRTDARTVSIGAPTANTHLVVLDDHGALVPFGVEGELHIGGPGLALGYLDDPSLTASRFITGPDGQRLYRTGDVVLQRPNGDLEIRGRLDDQVKIRGFRIEPGEVEHALTQFPDVAACAVIARRESQHVHFLAAYVVLIAGSTLDGDDLRRLVRGRLPEPMVPTTVTVLPALPLTSNGKIDRAALPDPRSSGGAPAASADVGHEATVARIWADVLHVPVDTLAFDQDFFELGGHSLLLIQVAARLRKDLQVDVPLRLLINARTIRTLAAVAASADTVTPDLIPILDRQPRRGFVDAAGRLIGPPALLERIRAEAI